MSQAAVTEGGRPALAVFLGELPRGGAQRALVTMLPEFTRVLGPIDLVLLRERGAFLSEVPPSVRIVEIGKASRRAARRAVLQLWLRGGLGLGLREALALPAPAVARGLPTLARYLRNNRPRALLTTLYEFNILALWAAALAGGSCRVVIREANTFSLETRSGPFASQAQVLALARAWYPRASAVVAVSQGVADDLAATLQLPAGLAHVVHNGVAAERVQELARAPLDHPWLADAAGPVLVAAGRLAPQKDYPTLLRALAIVRRSVPARLVILGEGAERPALEALRGELGLEDAVDLLGEEANVFRFMGRASALVLSSRYEGFPNVLVEALACGCPVVATDCPHGPMTILDGGRFGRLVPVGDPPALAGAILATLGEMPDREALVARALEFRPERTAARYLELIGPGHAPAA